MAMLKVHHLTGLGPPLRKRCLGNARGKTASHLREFEAERTAVPSVARPMLALKLRTNGLFFTRRVHNPSHAREVRGHCSATWPAFCGSK